MKKIGLYIHIPFCNHICSYCDFVKRVSNDFIKKEYFESLINELELKKPILKKYIIKTIYIGGGTPSSISLELLNLLMRKLQEIIQLESLEEFTFECNIEDISYDLCKLLMKYHINRVSIGIESLNSKILQKIGRDVNLLVLSTKMRILRNFGLNNINFDYIYGIEPMTINETISDLEQLITLKPTHFSCYSLILEEKTILHHEYLKGNFKLMDEDKETIMYDSIVNFLESNGYKRYEISNFALGGYESKHNIIYWSNEEYLGIGLNSSSYLDKCRFKNIDNLLSYIKYFKRIDNKTLEESFKKTITDIEKLTINEIMDYELILGLRMTKGINTLLFNKKFNKKIEAIYPNIKKLIEKNYLDVSNDYLKINPKYFYLQNQILLKLLDS